MKNIKGVSCIIYILSSSISYAEEQYFNPQFLGQDPSSVQDLNYLNKGNEITPGNYYLDLYIGDKLIKHININFYNENEKVVACFDKDIIEILPLNKIMRERIKQLPNTNECLNIESIIPEMNYKVDLPQLVFKVSIPQIYLESKNSSLAEESDWDDGISGLLMNYNFMGTNSKNGPNSNYSSYYFYLNNKLNVGAWRLYGNMYWNENKNDQYTDSEFKTSGFYLTRDIRSLKSTILIGQNSLGSSLFDAIQYVGVTLGTSKQMRPESENGYAPPIRGIATTRSKLIIRQNNLIVYQTLVDPGPYDIQDLYPVGSSGDYEVELTSLDGVVIEKYNVPYAVLQNLLKEKNYEYTATIGQLDLKSAKEYKFIQGSFAYGLPYRTTIYGGIQGYSDYQSLGIGFAKDFGRLGAVSVDMVNADTKFSNYASRVNGQSYRILFAKSFIGTKTNIQLTGYRYSTSGFYTLNEAVYKNTNNNGELFDDNLLGRKRSTFQLNISQNLDRFGQLYIWGTKNTYWGDNKNSENIQFGWNKTFPKLNNLVVTLNYNKQKYSNMKNDSIAMNLVMPLNFRKSKKNTVYAGSNSIYNKTSDSFVNNLSIYGRTDDNKLNYSMYQSLTNESKLDTMNFNLKYDLSIIDLDLGASYSESSKQLNYGFNGSLLMHEGGFSFFKQAFDTAILVEAKGASGATLSRAGDNVKINRNGYALIPYATAYHYNDIEINPESFKNGFDIDEKILKVAPTNGAIAKVSFDVRKGYNFLIKPMLNGENIKFGTIVENIKDKSTAIANDDGSVYMTGVKDNSEYKVYWDKDKNCHFKIQYNDKFNEGIINKSDVSCEVIPNE